MNQQLAIVFEDDHCLAVAKPPGQFTQGTWAPAGETTLETAVRQYLEPADPGSAYLGIVHRLDRPSSGLLLWAKTLKAARRLSAQFERRAVSKEYWAVVELTAATTRSELGPGSEQVAGDSPDIRVWNDWLTRANELGVASAVEPRRPGAGEAVTHWRRGGQSRCRPVARGYSSGPRPAGPISSGSRRRGEGCPSWEIPRMARH